MFSAHQAVAEPRSAADAGPCPCYHCGETVPYNAHFEIEIGGESRAMCCPGCRAVASLIAANGLENFYQQRTAYNERPVEAEFSPNDQYLIYDDPEMAQRFSEMEEDGTVTARLLLGGITCAACTWLIEQSLGACGRCLQRAGQPATEST